MATPKRNSDQRNVTAGARTFLATSSTDGRRRLLQSERSVRLFIRTLYEYRDRGIFRLHEFVVMPDHFHLLITIDSGTSIERAVQFVKGGFAFRACKEFGMRAPIWQKGFSDRRVRGPGPDEFQRIRIYIHNNPIKAGLADKVEQYPYSSAHDGFELDVAPITLDPQLLTAVLHVQRELPDKATKHAFLSAISRAG